MKLLNLYLFTTLFPLVRSTVLSPKKICRDCKYFIGDKLECRKFGDTNVVTGEITYNSARSVRSDEKKCGEDGIHFEENQFKIITEPYYFVKQSWILVLSTSFIALYVYAVAISLKK